MLILVIQPERKIKKGTKEILSLATAWMDMGDIVLSKIRRTDQDQHCVILRTQGAYEVELRSTGQSGAVGRARTRVQSSG